MTCLAVSPFTMPAALAAADTLLGNPKRHDGLPDTSRPLWLGKPHDEEQAAWLASFRRRADLAASMPEIHRNATSSAADHVAWLKSEGWEAQITQGTLLDLFLASTLNIVAKWQTIGRAYKERDIDRVLLKKGARTSTKGSGHPVVEVITQHPGFTFCFQQAVVPLTKTAELMTSALDMVGQTHNEEIQLDFPMVDLRVRKDAAYMIGLHSGKNVVTQAAEQLRLELNEVGGRASAAAEIAVKRSVHFKRAVKIDGPFVVAISRNAAPKDADKVVFAAYVDRDAWKKPAEGRI